MSKDQSFFVPDSDYDFFFASELYKKQNQTYFEENIQQKNQKIDKQKKIIFDNFNVNILQNSIEKAKSKKKKQINLLDFTVIDQNEIENTEQQLTDAQWTNIIGKRNHVLFQQNIIIIKNQLIKTGTNINTRYLIWSYLANIDKTRKTYRKINYSNIKLNNNHKDFQQIQKDIDRTFLPLNKDCQQKKIFLDSVMNILRKFLSLKPSVGYVQGMNVIVTAILYGIFDGQTSSIFEAEENAFWLFVALIENYDLEKCYTNDMKKITQLSNQLEIMLLNKEPVLYNFINQDDVKQKVQRIYLSFKFIFYFWITYNAFRTFKQNS